MDELRTIRDYLRFGVTEFTRARLVFGHGTATAVDEAAFLILTALDLPPDELAPWLDCRLTRAECDRIADLISARVRTRKPAPYLVGAAYIQGRRFTVDERVIVPRSFIGELMVGGGLDDILDDPGAVHEVLDMCTGSGCLAILAAEAFPDARIDATDLSADALAVAAINVASYGLADRISLICSDLFEALPPGPRYDLILANPPYVAAAEIAVFDPEYRAEPLIAHAGGDDGLDIIHRIMAEAPPRLAENGTLVMEIGTGRAAFEARYADLPVLWLSTETSDGEVLAVNAAALAALTVSSIRPASA